MDITVLGCGAAFPRAGGACSGFLVHADGTSAWLEAGNGTFSRMEEVHSFREIDALILSHSHSDHWADVIPIMYARGFEDPRPTPLPVYAPADVPAKIVGVLGGSGASVDLFHEIFDFKPLTVEPFEVGSLRFEPFRTLHPPETYGVRMRSDGKLATFTSDTAFFPELPESCGEADLLICEATYIDGIEAEPNVHLWAPESGAVGAKAGAKRMLLTHVWGTFDPEQAAAEASETFGAPVEAAVERRRYTV
jgi:ribonuclease BN (tRNA processing enzyme)